MNCVIENPTGLIAALDRGISLPASFYTDPAIVDLEVQRVFRKFWNYIGPMQRLKNVGDYITGYAGELPVVVMRNESGLGAFINACRHRRHEVMKGHGNSKMMQCGYHAWTYDLTGCLKGAPRSAMEPNFRLEDYPLLPLRVEALGPWVFVNVDQNAAPLRSYFGKVLDVIAQSGIDVETLELYARDEWEARANWKTMLENYLECYHCAVAHPSFSAAIDVKPENYQLNWEGWFCSQIGSVRDSALEGKSQVKIYDVGGGLKQSQYHLLWPNITFNINPGFPNLSIDVWMPLGPNRTKGFSEQYFAPGVTEEFAQELIAFNAEVGAEDDVLTDSVQRGLIGGIPPQGRFLVNAEHLALGFQKLVVASLAEGDSSRLLAEIATPLAPREITLEPTPSALTVDERNTYVELEVVKVERESDIISSFYLRRADGKKLYPWEAGQFLPIRVTIPGHDKPAIRTYTISTACNPDHYRLSIRRADGNALVSQFLHANAKPGLRIEAMAPRGKFVLDRSDRPVVFLSGGVGLTPMIAMTEHIVEEGRRTGTFRPIYFIHGTRSGDVHAFDKAIRSLTGVHPSLDVHVRYSNPGKNDNCEGTGHVTIDVVKAVVPAGDYEYYLCGPQPFMQSLHDGLIASGVSSDRIHYESFGSGLSLATEVRKPAAASANGSSTKVTFAKSGVTAEWSKDAGTLLELAEEAGLAPVFGCRSGICGTCATPLSSGAVDYIEEPLATFESGEVLLCCSIPRGDGGAVVLAL